MEPQRALWRRHGDSAFGAACFQPAKYSSTQVFEDQAVDAKAAYEVEAKAYAEANPVRGRTAAWPAWAHVHPTDQVALQSGPRSGVDADAVEKRSGALCRCAEASRWRLRVFHQGNVCPALRDRMLFFLFETLMNAFPLHPHSQAATAGSSGKDAMKDAAARWKTMEADEKKVGWRLF